MHFWCNETMDVVGDSSSAPTTIQPSWVFMAEGRPMLCIMSTLDNNKWGYKSLPTNISAGPGISKSESANTKRYRSRIAGSFSSCNFAVICVRIMTLVVQNWGSSVWRGTNLHWVTPFTFVTVCCASPVTSIRVLLRFNPSRMRHSDVIAEIFEPLSNKRSTFYSSSRLSRIRTTAVPNTTIVSIHAVPENFWAPYETDVLFSSDSVLYVEPLLLLDDANPSSSMCSTVCCVFRHNYDICTLTDMI